MKGVDHPSPTFPELKRYTLIFNARLTEFDHLWACVTCPGYSNSGYIFHCDGHFVSIQFNPTALRKAKVEYNFGLSECNRING